MDEIHHPTGGTWGSDRIDDEYEELLEEIFGDDALLQFKQYKNSAYLSIKDNFRKAKMSFYSDVNQQSHRVKLTTEFMEAMVSYNKTSLTSFDESDTDYVQKGFQQLLKGYRDYKIELIDSEYLHLSTKLWQERLFDKVIDPIIDHVNGKIDEIERSLNDGKKFSYLLLAGGLAVSPYFKMRMQEAFGPNSSHKLSIRLPRAPILSVVDGALRLGLRPDYIKTRRVKVTYGIAVDRGINHVDQSKLPKGWMDENTYIQRHTNRRIVRNLFSPFITMNDPIGVNEPIHKEYRRFSKKDKSVNLAIYQSNANPVPYVIPKGQKKLAGVQVPFPANYNKLQFVVEYYFGDTMLRAKVIYTTKEDYRKWKDNVDANDRQAKFDEFDRYLELKYEYYES